jgi:SAM-dependent methyltransferase
MNFTSTGPGVIAADLARGIPFPDESFSVVYHSHLLEHFAKPVAGFFLKECHRILKPSGVIRVAVPDLEGIVRNYLVALENARAGVDGWDHNYDWMMLEMYDQVVRNESGGEMARYLGNANLANERFVVDRCGAEAKNIIAVRRKETGNAQPAFKAAFTKAKGHFNSVRKFSRWREVLLQLLSGKEYEVLKVGRFRLGGENHQWMYDSYSLSRLLHDSGFAKIVKRSATDSYIPGWSGYNLDTETDGSVYKPDSLFMEAIKP